VSASYGEYRYGVRAQGPWTRISRRITGSRERWRHASDTEALLAIETEYSAADDRVKPESWLWVSLERQPALPAHPARRAAQPAHAPLRAVVADFGDPAGKAPTGAMLGQVTLEALDEVTDHGGSASASRWYGVGDLDPRSRRRIRRHVWRSHHYSIPCRVR